MRSLSLIAVAIGLLAVVSTVNAETISYTFDSDAEGWTGTSIAWVSTGGQDGGYITSTRAKYAGYMTPPASSGLMGDVASNLGGNEITFSYYVKNLQNSIAPLMVQMFASVNEESQYWQYTVDASSIPTTWTQYTWTIDTLASEAPTGWVHQTGTASWADCWKNITNWNFVASSGNAGTTSKYVVNGLDTFVVTAVPEPSTLALLGCGLVGLLAYAWRKRK